GFKMKVLGYDPFVNQEMFDSEKTIITDLKTLVQKSDYISIHIPYNKETKNLFNYELLNLMKTSAFLINVARGGIINESDLALILSEEKIAGAAIDVFKQEPIEKENPLLNIKNILLSPHLGASTQEAKEGVSVSICEQICDYLKNDNLVNAVNTPISDLNKLKEMKPFLNLSELIGNLQNQLVASNPIKKVDIQCQGEIKDIKPILLSFLKGLLKPYVPERINYINAEAIAKELGIEIIINYSNMDTSYKNLISINTSTNQKSFRIDGSVFEDLKPRLVNIMDFKTEVHPRGTMLLIENIDVPGVIGNVGMFLGQLKINIGAYLLNRAKNAKNAFSIIRIDNDLSDIELQALAEIPEIIDIRQVNILGF
ncbi:MAG: phosphoglycerate dehydrogenase, partial [Candidatus Marinimicrobia bacterium]|nr:phosphoglycerate dehydrogenase [Candidatus Neomarinimicrobiota bacterium]